MKTVVGLWVFFSLFLVFSEEAVLAENIICEVDTKFFCNKNGCEETSPNGMFIKIDTEGTKSYQLCDPKGCDSYKIKNINVSGIFVSYQIQGNAFLKMAVSDEPLVLGIKRGDFFEQRDHAFGTFLSWCL